jgi:hypothetical protein
MKGTHRILAESLIYSRPGQFYHLGQLNTLPEKPRFIEQVNRCERGKGNQHKPDWDSGQGIFHQGPILLSNQAVECVQHKGMKQVNAKGQV